MRNSVVFAALSAIGLAQAATNYTVDGYTVDVSSISLTTRSTWCQAQDNTCTTLCDDNPKTETCDPDTLDYSCLCSNGSAPGLEYYTQTIPTFLCNEAYSECIVEYANNATGQEACVTDIQDNCGALDPSNYTAAATTTAASSTAASTASSTASASAAATTTVTSNAAPAMNHLGNGVAAVAVGLFAYLL